MKILVLNIPGDTVFQSDDLYSEYTDGLNLSPLLLSGAVTAATPIKSGDEYKMIVNIWDKKNKGTFTGEVNFNVIQNDKLEIDTTKVSYD